jgi:hypothetical protein
MHGSPAARANCETHPKPAESDCPGHRAGANALDPSDKGTHLTMAKLPIRARHRNGRTHSLPLLELLERRSWDDDPRAARWVARRCGIASPSVARLPAELANLGDQQ